MWYSKGGIFSQWWWRFFILVKWLKELLLPVPFKCFCLNYGLITHWEFTILYFFKEKRLLLLQPDCLHQLHLCFSCLSLSYEILWNRRSSSHQPLWIMVTVHNLIMMASLIFSKCKSEHHFFSDIFISLFYCRLPKIATAMSTAIKGYR